MPLDFKKTQKEWYQPKTTPTIVDVPEMTFITVDGSGDPNSSKEYIGAVELLYGLSYTIKMNYKDTLEYVVPPLEGFWSMADEFRGGGASIKDKSKFVWTMMIRQPDFVTEEVFLNAKNIFEKKKPGIDTALAQRCVMTEGLCVQVLHLGAYDDEPATIVVLDGFAEERGYIVDINEKRRHHEIYLSDPRKVAAEKLKTVIRHPIRKG